MKSIPDSATAAAMMLTMAGSDVPAVNQVSNFSVIVFTRDAMIAQCSHCLSVRSMPVCQNG